MQKPTNLTAKWKRLWPGRPENSVPNPGPLVVESIHDGLYRPCDSYLLVFVDSNYYA
jgi:hypothetical protein